MASMKEVKIGRMSSCDIKINDSGLSRTQCVIRFDNGWHLIDADGTPGRTSTNGTWVYVDESFLI